MKKSLSKQALRIFLAGLDAANPAEAVSRYLKLENDRLIAGHRRYHLHHIRNIYVIGAGKASAAMAKPVERMLGKRIRAGLVNVKYGHTAPLRRIELSECGHPVPDRNGVAGAERIAQIARDAGEDDLVIGLISGGASALLPLPAPPITLEEKQETTRLLLRCGATIHEFNCVRKHLSRIKGGQLAHLAYPARMLTLILSDVIGDDLDVIGSGPTVPDPSTYADAKAIFCKYGIFEELPASVHNRIDGDAPETPKPGNPVFARVQNLVVGSNRLAVDAAAAEARRLGFHTLVLSTFIEGETRDAARMHTAIAKEILASGRPVRPPACVISGGETIVTIRGQGLGGRNQEFVLAAAHEIAGLKNVTIVSAGTDGTDGPTDAAGAIADDTSIARAQAAGLSASEFLANNDSYHFFDKLGDLVKTGPTGTNVMDIRVLLVKH